MGFKKERAKKKIRKNPQSKPYGHNKNETQDCNVTNKNKGKTSAKQASILEYIHWFQINAAAVT